MSAEGQPEEQAVRRKTPYSETIQAPAPVRNPPIQYTPSKPQEVFETYRDVITRNVQKVWPKTPDDYHLEPFQASFRYYDYGGQYNLICELPDGRPTYITITESFEKEDGALANDEEERKRRGFVSVS